MHMGLKHVAHYSLKIKHRNSILKSDIIIPLGKCAGFPELMLFLISYGISATADSS